MRLKQGIFWRVESPRPTQRGLSRKHVFDACHAALKRLRVDYLDLYYCHRPDPEVPIAETILAMDTLIRQGRVLYWDHSIFCQNNVLQACVGELWEIACKTVRKMGGYRGC